MLLIDQFHGTGRRIYGVQTVDIEMMMSPGSVSAGAMPNMPSLVTKHLRPPMV
jgi:hypothetical protein